MAKNQDEIAEDERDEEDALDDDEDTDEEDESDEDDDSGEDEEEDDDSDDDDSDDEPALPKTQKELNKLITASIKSALNRKSAAERTSKKPLSERKRPVSDSRVDEHERVLSEMKASEAKRQFGYEHSLAPDEVDVVFRLSKKPSAKTLRDPVVKGALEGYRTAKRARANTPSGTDRSIKIGSKDHSKLPPAERKSQFALRRQQVLDSQRGR